MRAIFGIALGVLTALQSQAQVARSPSTTQQSAEETCNVSGMVIRQTDSAPLKGAVVQLVGEEREHSIAAKSGADGRFELKNVPAGQYRLTVSRNGYFNVEYGQKKPTDPGAKFSLRPGQHMSDLLFKLSRAGVTPGTSTTKMESRCRRLWLWHTAWRMTTAAGN